MTWAPPKQSVRNRSGGEMSFLHFLVAVVISADLNTATPDSGNLFVIGFDDGLDLQRGRKLREEAIGAVITQEGDSVVMRCQGRATNEVSWWYYPCPAAERIQLTREVVRKQPEHYELLTARTADNTTSSLRVKNLKSVSGLYRCGWHHPDSTHYFIVGRKTSLGRCFPSESGALLKTIQGLIGVAENGGDTFEYILKLPRGEGGTHDYRIRFSLPGGSRHELDNERKLGNLHVIKFDESDAVGAVG